MEAIIFRSFSVIPSSLETTLIKSDATAVVGVIDVSLTIESHEKSFSFIIALILLHRTWASERNVSRVAKTTLDEITSLLNGEEMVR